MSELRVWLDERREHPDASVSLWFVQECADAGWWMGEIGGRQGVFPDNFVKLLEVEKEVIRAAGHVQKSRGGPS